MADEGNRGPALSETRFQPFNRDQVQMIGRLVEQQDIGFRAECPDQRRLARFAAGQTRGIGGRVEPELSHHGARRIGVHVLAEPGEHIFEGRREAGCVRLLRQVSKAR